MGNCFRKPKISYTEVGSSDSFSGSPIVRLYGPASCPRTTAVRIALLYKNVNAEFAPLESPNFGPETTAVLQCEKETVSGPAETLVRYIDRRFAGPPLLPSAAEARQPAIVAAARLQHRSVAWHLDRLAQAAEELAAPPPRKGWAAPRRPRIEVRNFARSYSQLLEVMMEHARMEERVVFPVLEKADRGVCKTANDEHARDFPIMNGITEDIKSIGVLETGGTAFEEAMSQLATKLRTLQENCKEHFEEEERELLPLLEAADMSREQQEKALAGCFEEEMKGTHSHLFHFLISALLPSEAMQYLDLVCRCCSRQRAETMLRSLTAGDMSWEEHTSPAIVAARVAPARETKAGDLSPFPVYNRIRV